MTYEEYETMINEGMQNADKAPATFKSVLENLKADLTTLNNLTEANASQEQRIRDLQDTNMKLYLAQTSPAPEEENKPELTRAEKFDAFVTELKNMEV